MALIYGTDASGGALWLWDEGGLIIPPAIDRGQAQQTRHRASMLSYAPSTTSLPTPHGGQVVGQFTTLAIGFAVFQVFTVDYVEADVRKAKVWNPGPPDSVANAVRLIWPHRLRSGDVAWPLPFFPNESFDQLVNWDGALRRGVA